MADISGWEKAESLVLERTEEPVEEVGSAGRDIKEARNLVSRGGGKPCCRAIGVAVPLAGVDTEFDVI